MKLLRETRASIIALAFAAGIILTAGVLKLLAGVEKYDVAVLLSGPILVGLGLTIDRALSRRRRRREAQTLKVASQHRSGVRPRCAHGTAWKTESRRAPVHGRMKRASANGPRSRRSL